MALVQKAFSDIITFSRSSNATRVGPTGLVEYAPHNLLLQSQTFQTTWLSDANRGSITADAAAAPDGTVTAEKLVAGSDNFGYRYQNLTIVNSTVYTASAYLKSSELTFGYIEVPGGNITYFNLSTGVVSAVGSGAAATIISVGNGWYRCSVTFTSNTTSGFVNLGAANASGSQAATNGSGIYIWGAQLSVGPYALDYTPTTSAAVYGPRFDYDPSGVTIVDPVSRNLLTYSEDFTNAAWVKTVAGDTVTANAGVAPDGTTTADKLVADTTSSGAHRIYQSVSTSGVHTLSVYAKAAGYSSLVVTSSANNWVYFNLAAGTVSSSLGTGWSAATITDAGNGWYRCTATTSNSNTAYFIGVFNGVGTDGNSVPTFAGNGTDGILIWGAQLEVGSTATSYMVSGATNGFRAVPVTSGTATARGLLVEEQRTNICIRSEDFSASGWTLVNATVSTNVGIAPDGTQTANLLIPNSTSSADHSVYRLNGTFTGTYTTSCYAKAAGYNFVEVFDGTGANRLRVNLTDGSYTIVGSPAAVSVTAVGNGWYRCSFTRAISSALQYVQIGAISDSAGSAFSGNGFGGVLIWGAQQELGSFPTSYIPTLASTVTRSADVASVNTLSPWFNNTEFSVYYEFQTFGLVAGVTAPYMGEFGDGTVDNRVVSYLSNTDGALYVISGGVLQTLLSEPGAANNTLLKYASAVKQNDFATVVNGTAPTTSSSGTVPAVTSFAIGHYPIGIANFLNGWMRRIAFYPRRLTNAELQALTA